MSPDARAAELGIAAVDEMAGLPFRSVRRAGHLLYSSGHVGAPFGEIGGDLSIEEGMDAARDAVARILGSVLFARGTLAGLAVVSLTGHLRAVRGFDEHPRVMSAASDLIARVFGAERGAHARLAIGAATLPMGAAVEVQAVFHIEIEQ